MGKDFVLDHGCIVPDVYMFNGNRWDLMYARNENFSRGGSGANVPYLSYEYPPESIRNGCVDANEVELDGPLRQSVDLDV